MPVFDESNFSSIPQALELFNNSIRGAFEYDAYGNTTVFKAVVLTDPVRIDEALASVYGTSAIAKKLTSLLSGSPSTNKFLIRARIDSMNPPSPHAFIPDPCSIEFADKPEEAAKLIAMHTLFVSTESSTHLSIKVGDLIDVRLEDQGSGIYNLQYGEIVGLASTSPPSAQASACQKISELISPEDKFSFAALATAAIGLMGDWMAMGGNIEGGPANRNGYEFYEFAKSLNVLDASVRGDFEAFFAELVSLGYSPKITSARRSVKHQWLLRTGLGGKGYKTAKPCYSDHQYGFAIDMNATDPQGTYISKKSSHTRWQPIANVASKHNIKWYGSGDEVHFKHRSSSSALPALKAKCKAYYYGKYGSDYNNWPKTKPGFADELAYIEPPTGGGGTTTTNPNEEGEPSTVASDDTPTNS